MKKIIATTERLFPSEHIVREDGFDIGKIKKYEDGLLSKCGILRTAIATKGRDHFIQREGLLSPAYSIVVDEKPIFLAKMRFSFTTGYKVQLFSKNILFERNDWRSFKLLDAGRGREVGACRKINVANNKLELLHAEIEHVSEFVEIESLFLIYIGILALHIESDKWLSGS